MVSWLRTHERGALRWLLALAFVGYAGLLTWQIGAYAGAADSSGYLNQARLLRAGKIHTRTRTLTGLPAPQLSAYAYVPLGFSPANPGDPTEMVANYPIGLPLLIALSSVVVGWNFAAPVTMLLHALSGVLIVYVCAREFRLSRISAVAAAALLALSPLYVFTALQTLSDGPALVWVTLAILAACRSETRSTWAVAAGGAFGMAFLIRPTNALALLPIAFALGINMRRWIAFGFSAMPAVATWLAYNYFAYGHSLRSGYGPIWNAFHPGYALATLKHYLIWLPIVLTPAMAFAPGLPWVNDTSRRVRLILVTWMAAFFGFYLFYPYTQESWWYLRFVLPAFPALILAVFLVLEAMVCRCAGYSKSRWRQVAMAGGGFALAWAVISNRALHTLNVGQRERAYAEAGRWAQKYLPSNAVVFAMQTSGAVYYYTDFPVVHWTFTTAEDVAAIDQTARDAGQPIFAMVFPYEEAPLLHSVFPGKWEMIETVQLIRIWRRVDSYDGP